MEPLTSNYTVLLSHPHWGPQRVYGVTSYNITHRDGIVSAEFSREGAVIGQFFGVTAVMADDD